MRSLFDGKWLQAKDHRKALRALFSADGGFGVYPGPAAYLHHDGAVIVANDEAARLAALLGFDTGQSFQPDLGAAIRGALRRASPSRWPMRLPMARRTNL